METPERHQDRQTDKHKGQQPVSGVLTEAGRQQTDGLGDQVTFVDVKTEEASDDCLAAQKCPVSDVFESVTTDLGEASVTETGQNVIEHKTETFVSKQVVYSCAPCGYRTKWKHALQRHVRAKHLGVVYMCNLCDYVATQKDSIAMHTKAQHEGLTYKCPYCEYTATRKPHLDRHIEAKHQGVVYSCPHCTYKAPRKGCLNRHVRSQHDGITYSCDQCEYQTAHKFNLNKHTQSKHPRVFLCCPKCDFKVAQKRALYRHIRCNHEGSIYCCDICDFFSPYKGNVTKHKKLKHGGDLALGQEGNNTDAAEGNFKMKTELDCPEQEVGLQAMAGEVNTTQDPFGIKTEIDTTDPDTFTGTPFQNTEPSLEYGEIKSELDSPESAFHAIDTTHDSFEVKTEF